MTESKEFTANEDTIEQEILPVYIKKESTIDNNEPIDYSKVYILPSIKTRYFSMLIDICIIFLLTLGISSLFELIGEVPDYVRGILFVIVFILYEPILITIGSTVGQYLLKIRVRRFNNPEKKVLFPLLLLRLIVKGTLGWLSFITVTFNLNRRAIHDFVCGSIMVAEKIKE